MIIRGIIDKSLSKQTCIRGFARIKALARMSKANPEYQRELINKQKQVIKNFLTEEEYLFFPEVILSLKLKYDYTKTGAKAEQPLTLIETKKNFKSNVDGISVKVIQQKNNKTFDTSGRDEIKIAEIEIEEWKLNELIENNDHPFHRIDGNHRLSAAEQVDDDRIQTMDVPFCVVLFEEITTSEFNPTTGSSDKVTKKEFEKFEKVVFYNINSKTIPLTLEENLKVLIDDEVNFTNEELQKVFEGLYPIKTRELIARLNSERLSGIKHIVGKNFRSYYNDIFKRLLSEEASPDTVVDDVFESILSINQEYKNTPELNSNSCFGLLTAFLYYHIQGNSAKFELFKNWIINNHLFEIDEVKADSIIKIFDKVAEQETKVFVAMPYFDRDPEIVADYNTIYQNAIDEIKDKYGVKISLFEIMNNKGATQDQIQDIINKIKQCTIFIADISGNNSNVLYETGWARALDKHVLLFREEKSEKPKSDYVNDTHHIYKNSARATSLKKITVDNIVEVLTKNFGLISKQ